MSFQAIYNPASTADVLDLANQLDWLRKIKSIGFEWMYVDWADVCPIEVIRRAGLKAAVGFPGTHAQMEHGPPIAWDHPWGRAFPDNYDESQWPIKALEALQPEAVVVGANHCNEISYPADDGIDGYSAIAAHPHVREKWVRWLARGFGDVESLNRLRSTSVGAFEEVEIAEDPHLARSFVDWLVTWKLVTGARTVRRVCPRAEVWLSPMIDTCIARAPYPVQYIISRVAAQQPIDGILVFGGNWFIDPRDRLLSTVGSFIKSFPVKTIAGGCNRLAGLRGGAGRRLVGAGFNSVVCGVDRGDDLEELRGYMDEMRSLPKWRPFVEVDL